MTEQFCRMASKRKKKPGRTETVHQGGGAGRQAQVKEFLRRAPRFTTLANTAEGRERELSPSQRDFLDDFAAKLAEGAMEANDEA